MTGRERRAENRNKLKPHLNLYRWRVRQERVEYVFVHLFQLYFYGLLYRTQEVRDFNPITNSLAQWTLVDGSQPAVTEHLPHNVALKEEEDRKMGFPVKV